MHMLWIAWMNPWTRSRCPKAEGVKLLANAGAAHKPRCQPAYNLHHPLTFY
jgi:hypothetical protein